jgi:DNA-directed RNA polymerase subunit RPC12/RpoP
MEAFCFKCGEQIYDTQFLDRLPDKLVCTACGAVNIIRPKVEPVKRVKTTTRRKRRL